MSTLVLLSADSGSSQVTIKKSSGDHRIDRMVDKYYLDLTH